MEDGPSTLQYQIHGFLFPIIIQHSESGLQRLWIKVPVCSGGASPPPHIRKWLTVPAKPLKTLMLARHRRHIVRGSLIVCKVWKNERQSYRVQSLEKWWAPKCTCAKIKSPWNQSIHVPFSSITFENDVVSFPSREFNFFCTPCACARRVQNQNAHGVQKKRIPMATGVWIYYCNSIGSRLVKCELMGQRI